MTFLGHIRLEEPSQVGPRRDGHILSFGNGSELYHLVAFKDSQSPPGFGGVTLLGRSDYGGRVVVFDLSSSPYVALETVQFDPSLKLSSGK